MADTTKDTTTKETREEKTERIEQTAAKQKEDAAKKEAKKGEANVDDDVAPGLDPKTGIGTEKAPQPEAPKIGEQSPENEKAGRSPLGKNKAGGDGK